MTNKIYTETNQLELFTSNVFREHCGDNKDGRLDVYIKTLFLQLERKVPGLHTTNQQEELYMQQIIKGLNQDAAAKAGISVRSGRRIELSPTIP